MTHRMVRVLCSAILLALILVSLALPLRQQTTALADEECRGGFMTSSGRSCESATLADGGTNGWWRDGDPAPVADGGVEECRAGQQLWARNCEPEPA